MSMERRSEIYVTRKLASRLRTVLKLYPQNIIPKVMQQDGDNLREFRERLMTVEELVERHLNQVIETEYPLVLELEKEYSKLEKLIMEKGKAKPNE